MVSLVIVSHSAKLAEGVVELARQMVQDRVAIAVAAGIDDPEQPIGTDALRVHAAIESVFSDDGVVVLMDLGSAVLSAETALEFLTPEQRGRVYLSEAPLVEGAVAAAVQASVGGTVAQVIAEARGALAAKADQLKPDDAPEPQEKPAAGAAPAGAARELRLTVPNRLGLHARPAARFVSTANRFAAAVTVHKGERAANAKSINQVATLGVRQGDVIRVTAQGPDAEAALAALQALADENFGDVGEPAASAVPAVAPAAVARADELAGIPAAPGVAVGPVFQYRPRLAAAVARQVDDPAAERARLQEAIATAMAEIRALHQTASRQVGAAEADIFEAHLLFLQDPALLDRAEALLSGEGLNAEAAWWQAVEETAAVYRALDDAYMQARAADVLDAGQRVLRRLMGLERPALELAEPSILVAADLAPSDTARLDARRVLGICTELGGSTSHSAILARALGIPAVVGLGPALEALPEGQIVGLDGDAGRLWLRPDAAQQAELAARRAQWLAGLERMRAAGQAPAVTRDGRPIEVAANIGAPGDAAVALTYGAEGVGLFRTEFLFLDRETAPTEEEQYEAYRQAAAHMGDRPLIIRTLDVGGDKPLAYADLGAEENPFLGWRGIRFCLDRPAIFKPQLRAILRASHGHNVKLMYPMVGAVGEVRAAAAMLAEARAELAAAGLPFDEALEVGIMIEVPAAAALADVLAREVDFFSIGTNDLTQYVMAADRGNARVAGLANALQPAVLRLVRQTADAGHAAGIWVGMCGELAGNPLATPVLVGLGLDELSMNAPAIPAVKEAIRRLTVAEAQEAAAAVLAMASAEEVEAYLGRLHRERGGKPEIRGEISEG